MLNRKQVAVSVLVLGLFLIIGQAQGAFVPLNVDGTNTVLDNNGGTLYIPLKQSSSGVLGVGGVGLSQDSVTLSGANPASDGYVSFLVEFDLSNDLGAGDTVQDTGATLLLQFDDLDFVTISGSGRAFWETVEIEFLANAGDTPTGGLVIDKNNYTNYGGSPPTNNTTRTYALDMKSDLNVGTSGFNNMSTDKEFALWVTLTADITYSKSSRYVSLNTPEDLDGSFNFTAQGVPEPASMTLLAIGGLGVLIRRRKR